MPDANDTILAINAGSSSIKLAYFNMREAAACGTVLPLQTARLEGIGAAQSSFVTKAANSGDAVVHAVVISDIAAAVKLIIEWIEKQIPAPHLVGMGHRIVHGGPHYWKPERFSQKVLTELQELAPFDTEHLPAELSLVEALAAHFADVPQILCFDTAFHHDLPNLSQLLPIPRKYFDKGIRRYGFHGLSCEFLMQELSHIGGAKEANERVVIAHLGGGASITAVRGGKSFDTSMALTPAAGLPMGRRAGDLDPGLAAYLARTEGMSSDDFQHMVNHASGLIGISETSSDMRELIHRQPQDTRAAEAVALFCYQTKKWICAFAGALEGIDTLIFSGGIGENIAQVRSQICAGLQFMGIEINVEKNSQHAAVISSAESRVSVRVIPTNEELVIAQKVCQMINNNAR